MLNNYLSATLNLLQSPPAPQSIYSNSVLTGYINTARGQLAGDSECIRVLGTIQTTVGIRNYNFSSIAVSGNGVQGVMHVRAVRYGIAMGYQWVAPRPWEWFDRFAMSAPLPLSGPPKEWSQYGQGASPPQFAGLVATGSFFVDPLPDAPYSLICDCVCYPSQLALDTDPEAIPYQWTDAVPYFAAYLALMGAQTVTRMGYAKELYQLYQLFAKRARTAANPSVLRGIYPQADDVTLPGKLGVVGGRG